MKLKLGLLFAVFLIESPHFSNSTDVLDAEKPSGAIFANITDFPWTALIRVAKEEVTNENSIKCGATIIGYRWVLTTKSCFSQKEYTETKISVGLSDLRPEDEAFYEMGFSVCHPFSSTLPGQFDVCLVRVNGSIDPSEKVAHARLPRVDEETVHSAVNISGYGLMHENDATNYRLKAMSMWLAPNDTCQSSYKWFDHVKQLCASTADGNAMACNGDFGAGLVALRENLQPVILGVLNRVQGTRDTCINPVFAVKVSHLTTWIKDTIRDFGGDCPSDRWCPAIDEKI